MDTLIQITILIYKMPKSRLRYQRFGAFENLMVAITVAHVCILATEETELQQPAPAKSL
jgi:hypothetical protein